MSYTITELYFVETGQYHELALRPYQGRAERHAVMAVQEATQGGRSVSSEGLAGIAGEIIRPQSEVGMFAQIGNGWNNRRLRFLMTVEFPGQYGTTYVQYVSGFTDYFDPSHTGRLDPNMRLYFNNSIQTQRFTEHTPYGPQYIQKLGDASQIISGSYMPDYSNPGGSAVTMRPSDVFSTVGTSMLRGMGDTVINGNANFAMSALKKSRRHNTSAPNYLSNLIQHHIAAVSAADEDDTLEKVMGRAAGLSKDPLIAQDRFLHELTLQTALAHNGSITYGELCSIDPYLDPRVQVFTNEHGVQPVLRKEDPLRPVTNRENHEHWQGTTNDTVMATILAHSVPAIMMDLMLTVVTFTATNRTIDGSVEIKMPAYPNSFAKGVDLSQFIQHFLHRLRHEVLVDLSLNNAIDYYVEVMIDVLGDTNIAISTNGRPLVRYVVPSFADALFSPILAPNALVLDNLAHEVSRVVDNLHVNYAPAAAVGQIPSQPHPQIQMVNNYGNPPGYLDVL